MQKDRFRRLIFLVCGFFLLTGIFNSCGKEAKEVLYKFGCLTADFTPPGDIADPELRDVYKKLLGDLTNDIFDLHLDNLYGVEIAPKALRAEDEKWLAEYNRHLPEVKALEATYRKRISEIEKNSGASFFVKVTYLLYRSAPGNTSEGVLLQQYDFELNYN